jgi:predicted transcriptional regulator
MLVGARDIIGGKDLWSYKLPVLDATTVTVDNGNVYGFFGNVKCGNDEAYADLLVQSNRVNCTITCPGQHLEDAAVIVKLWIKDASLYLGEDVIYATLYKMSYEEPVRFNVSKCVYSSNIYALDRNGTLLWSKPLDSIVRSAQVKDNTLYYSAGDRISKTQTDVAAGVALLAAAYVFVKFFCVGAVSRLKERMPKNRNRSRVLEYIRDDPGASLYEICRGTGMNVGTVRYHLLILGANHRIVSLQSDKKFVRYFPNSHTYSDQEQLVLSVMKRDSMRQVLGALAGGPGLTNRELAGITGIKESAMSRYMIELTEKGIVDRESGDSRHAYRIRSEYLPAVEMSIGRTGEIRR